MEFSNKHSIPKYIADWLSHDDYDHDHDPYTISATTIMKPVRAYVLSTRNGENLQQDVSDMIASKMGSAIHDSLEQIQTEGVIKEERVARTLSPSDDATYKVTGKFDVLEMQHDGTYILRDIKTTSVWAYIHGGKDDDYRTQLSIYRWLLDPTKEVQNTGFIDFFFTDWQGAKAKNDHKYPQRRLMPSYRVDLMPPAETEEYILSRLSLFEANRHLEEEDIVLCSHEELWSLDPVYAVTKQNAKRATKLCATEDEANKIYTRQEIKDSKCYLSTT